MYSPQLAYHAVTQHAVRNRNSNGTEIRCMYCISLVPRPIFSFQIGRRKMFYQPIIITSEYIIILYLVVVMRTYSTHTVRTLLTGSVHCLPSAVCLHTHTIIHSSVPPSAAGRGQQGPLYWYEQPSLILPFRGFYHCCKNHPAA